VDGVSFDLRQDETLGLVGESGSGKSMTALAVLRMVDIAGGRVVFDGHDITGLGRAGMRKLRRSVQMIFQDPYGSLNPRMKVARIIEEPLIVHGIGSTASERARRVDELLDLVGLDPAAAGRYPHEFSGGQRQRISIARALAVAPNLLVCDEPVSALDVSIQAQIINLLVELKRRTGLALLFIAHDLAIVRHISDRVAVMYAGRIVELADRDALYANPLHPYTQALLAAVAVPDPNAQIVQAASLQGEPPSTIDLPAGCPFSPRCPSGVETCRRERPPLQERDGRAVACHLYG
jgi:oligopeptide transport system ATP-binding protein